MLISFRIVVFFCEYNKMIIEICKQSKNVKDKIWKNEKKIQELPSINDNHYLYLLNI